MENTDSTGFCFPNTGILLRKKMLQLLATHLLFFSKAKAF
jgi:hypothetical protein